MMEAQDGRRSRRGKGEATESEAPPAPVDSMPSANGDTDATTNESTETQADAGKRRQRARKADVVPVEVKVGSWGTLTVRLPRRTIWRLKHHVADRPDITEGQLIASLLDAYLAQFDYPRQPEWLNKILKGDVPTEDVSAN